MITVGGVTTYAIAVAQTPPAIAKPGYVAGTNDQRTVPYDDPCDLIVCRDPGLVIPQSSVGMTSTSSSTSAPQTDFETYDYGHWHAVYQYAEISESNADKRFMRLTLLWYGKGFSSDAPQHSKSRVYLCNDGNEKYGKSVVIDVDPTDPAYSMSSHSLSVGVGSLGYSYSWSEPYPGDFDYSIYRDDSNGRSRQCFMDKVTYKKSGTLYTGKLGYSATGSVPATGSAYMWNKVIHKSYPSSTKVKLYTDDTDWRYFRVGWA